MAKKLKRLLKKLHIGRESLLALIFIVLAFILLRRIYSLQIINGEDYRNNFSVRTTKTLELKSTRGNIYDRNGKVLATNELSYSLTLTDAGSYSTNRAKALYLNGEAYRIRQILLRHGDKLDNDFHVILDEGGNYSYNVSGSTLLRFKADVYGRAKIDDLTDAEAEATADTMMAYLVSEDRFAVIRDSKPYTEEELEEAGLPSELTKEEILDIVYIRYSLFTTSYQKYKPVTIATSLSEASVAELQEEADSLTGAEVEEDSIRVYNDAEAFASILGYTGKISSEELTELSEESDNYTANSIIGKTGIESIMELYLQGTDGEQTVYVDNLGKVISVDEDSVIQPQSGQDVYLTIDADLQLAAYKILEQRIAGILYSVIINEKTFDLDDINDTSEIRIPIYDVYNALIENNVIDTAHFTDPDATNYEHMILSAHDQKQREVFDALKTELETGEGTAYKKLPDEMQEYESYIVNTLLTETAGILNSDAIDTEDETYIAWAKDETISLREFLLYAASQNWIDISSISTDKTYLSSDEVYSLICDYIFDYLTTDTAFDKIMYKYLILNDTVTSDMLINVLYDQGVLDKEDGEYESFRKKELSAYDLLTGKIYDLEITPAQLALEPCSGSVVVTDPNNGEVLACVSYPGYDNNRLANSMDTDYYNKLVSDESSPLYNKATQQRTAPGSTFKPVTTTAGLEEGAITLETQFDCTGVFDLIETPLSCWLKEGHGMLNVVGGIENSCNVFFSNVAYKLGTTEMGAWSDSLSLSKLQTYAELYDLDEKSGIEITEATPQVSTQYAIPSSIGQGTHAYTTTQLARYVSTIANSGTSYDLTLIDKVTTKSGDLVMDNSATVNSELSVSDTTWNAIHEGMRAVINSKAEFNGFGVSVAGKTGTAESSSKSPSHGLFIGYAPYEAPEVAIAVRIANGYSSTYAMRTAQDVLSYKYKLVDEDSLITGRAMIENVSLAQTD